MIELRITTRDELDELWLPWCVDRERPERIVRIDLEPERRDEARQLRVLDLAEDAVRAALSTYPREDGRDVLTAIEAFGAIFAACAGRLVVPDAEAFPMPEGPMLHEACHRSCGVYESWITDFEIRLRIHPTFGGWKKYEHPSLRR